MEFKLNLRVIWEGNLQLNYIKWNKNSSQEFRLSSIYDNKIKKYWSRHLKEFPNDYDGKLLFLDSFQFKDNYLLLNTSYMKFSTATYMHQQKIAVDRGIGVLGTQYLVFSPNNDYILIGKRQLSESYFPGAITIPGGILEINDLEKLPKVALLRELNEEVNLPLNPESTLVAILVGWNGVSVTFLVSTTIATSFHFNPKKKVKPGEDEWEEDLKWFPINNLNQMNKSELLDGLLYYISKISKNI
ncbi:MAG: NUDIX hydrolase [Promethearchaeota archaeon]